MRMLCLTKYTSRGPSSRYRVYQFVPHLEGEGIDVDVQSLHTDGYLCARYNGVRPPFGYLVAQFTKRILKICSATRYDIVFVQKEIFPYLPDFAESLLARAGVRMVLDLDDAVFLFYGQSPSTLKRRLLSTKFPRILKRSDLVLAGNRYLESYAGRYAKNVTLFPTVVDTDRFTPGASRPGGEEPVIGWIGSPETSSFLQEIVPALEQLSRQINFRFSIVGADAIDIRGVSVTAKSWREDEEVEDLRHFDIGVMPLPDTEWSKGKCALKLLQYMSVAIPAVSSPFGSAAEITIDGDNGFLASDRDAWVDKLGVLMKDRTLRRRIGQRGRDWVEQHYNLRRYAPLMAQYLKRLGEGRSAHEHE